MNASFWELLGYDPKEKKHLAKEWQGLINPDDLKVAKENFQKHCADPNHPYDQIVRYRHKNGKTIWVRCRGMAIRNEQGKAIRMLGAHIDLTSQKELEERTLELLNINVQLGNEIEIRKRAEQEIQDSDHRKDDFLAMLAHELRNPLSPISAAADILNFKNLSEEKIQQCSDVISRQVKHMTSLIDDLLDVSRVKRGLITLKQETINLNEIIAHSVEQVKSLVDSHKHQISIETTQESILVMGDQHRLIQVFTNILNNAAKYTPKGGNINLTLEAEGKLAKIDITDNGIGMDTDLIEHAFELFTQASRTADRSQGGLGIGLALVKSLVEMHQGKVTVSSQGIGKGSQFTVLLPRIEESVVDYASDNINDPLSLPIKNHGAKVMVVDDNAINAEMVATLLEMSGYKVVVEHDSVRALERSLIEIPSIYILDIGLPNMDGNELARRLRLQPETQNATLIALTGYSTANEISDALEAGFDHFVVKPFEFKKFMAILNNL